MQITEEEQELLEAFCKLPVKAREHLAELALRLAALPANIRIDWSDACCISGERPDAVVGILTTQPPSPPASTDYTRATGRRPGLRMVSWFRLYLMAA